MQPIEVNVSVLNGLELAWLQAPTIVRQELVAAMTEADALIEREVKERTPTGASGGGASGLKGSIFGEETVGLDNVIGLVGTAMSYATPVELGSKPHFPPIEPLIDWVVSKFGVNEQEARGIAFLVARKIARKGTKGAHMFQKAFDANEAQVNSMFVRAVARIAERCARGSA